MSAEYGYYPDIVYTNKDIILTHDIVNHFQGSILLYLKGLKVYLFSPNTTSSEGSPEPEPQLKVSF